MFSNTRLELAKLESPITPIHTAEKTIYPPKETVERSEAGAFVAVIVSVLLMLGSAVVMAGGPDPKGYTPVGPDAPCLPGLNGSICPEPWDPTTPLDPRMSPPAVTVHT